MHGTDPQDIALSSIDRAEALIRDKSLRDNQLEDACRTLKIFHPGKQYPKIEADLGFRVLDGYSFSYNELGDVTIGNNFHSRHESGKMITIIPKTADGSLAWIYWNNSKHLNLSDCIIKFGLGGWYDEVRDLRAKVIYLDADRSNSPKKCFFLAMDRPIHAQRVLVKGYEKNQDVFRIYQSAIPGDLLAVISLRELINIRDGDGQIPGFWNF
jgi:hypothetical protein